MSVTETTGDRLPRRAKLPELLIELIQAAEDEDRARFDVAFDACLDQVYRLTWRVFRDREWAEQVAGELLVRIVAREAASHDHGRAALSKRL
jgi:DNA-directed RNA polymerase specialized sigma24 family protein